MAKHRMDTEPTGPTDAQVEVAARLFYESQTGYDNWATSWYRPRWLKLTQQILTKAGEATNG